MKLFEKIKIQLINGKSRQIKFLGFPIFQYDVIYTENKKNKRYYFPFIKKNKNYTNENKETTVFYLKMNIDTNISMICLQHWIDTINLLDADFYIICDNKKLQNNILKYIIFKNSNIKFISSIRNPLSNLVKKLVSKNWINAAYAHLTTFFHAKQNNIRNFWNIDADDTMLIINSEKITEILKQAQKYAIDNNINAFSLDMWNSRTRGKYWSFGITYINNSNSFVEIFNNLQNNNWQKNCLFNDDINLDWYFTYLKQKNISQIKTFYIENTYFMHSCRLGNEFFTNIVGSYLCYWTNNKVIYPIISNIFEDEQLGIIPINKECIKLDIGIKKEECLNYAIRNITNLNILPEQLANLWNIKNSKYLT